MPLPAPTVFVPTLAGGDRLSACLEALLDQSSECELVVVDNGPGKGCAELLDSRFPSVKRVAFEGRNLGFGPALNRAVAAHGKGPVILLNDDAIPEPDFVGKLLAAHEASGAAMVAGVLLKAEAPGTIDSAGIVCDRTLTAWDYLTGKPVCRLADAANPFGPTGGGALFDREAFAAVGGFDERIFLYYEDLDLALRMRGAGYRCRLASDARARHEGSATLGRQAAAKYRQTGFSRGYLLRKYGVMKHPGLALKVLLSDSSAILAQAILDRTLAGGKGRLEGWRAAADTDRQELPQGKLEPARLGRHLKVRLNRRRKRTDAP